MVRGLDVFRKYFAGHADRFVLIGGTAATLAMEEAGLEFRATKDLDIVLHIEALSPAFGELFWSFVEAGRYEIRQASDTGKPVFYRFQKPADERFPVMLELFSRVPDGIKLAEGSHLTPIPIDDAVASLSAILLDDTPTTNSSSRAGGRLTACLGLARTGSFLSRPALGWISVSAKRKARRSIPRTFANTPTTCCACRSCLRRTFAFRWQAGSPRISIAFSMESRQIVRSIRSSSSSIAASPRSSNESRWRTS